MVSNRYKVPKAQWAKWHNMSKGLYNTVMYQGSNELKEVFKHLPSQTKSDIRVFLRNTAWAVASGYSESFKKLEKELC